MVNRFEARGMARKDAELVVSKMAQYENFFVGLMVAEELGLQIPEGEDSELITDAFIMFFSFGVFGSIPLLLHLLGNYNSFADSDLFMISAVVSLFLLSSLGMVKSTFSNASLLYSAFEALALGVICIALAYITGALLLDLIEP
jgi:VIT1/CCC1 family predicted Fe2+/Mn2+ transporter